jgi:DivIVA domain-containing protein
MRGAMHHNRRVDDTARQLPAPEFRHAGFGREGYNIAEVDEFVAELQRALRHDPPTMAPYEVADQRFRTARLRGGYRMREVDDYLDAAQDELRSRHGADAIAGLQGSRVEAKHFPTIWIYLVALVLIALIVGFAISQI